MKPLRSMPAGEFKAKCLDVLDRVAREGDALIVTKRGRPVAKIVPIDAPTSRPIRGSVTYKADITLPLGDDWPVDG